MPQGLLNLQRGEDRGDEARNEPTALAVVEGKRRALGQTRRRHSFILALGRYAIHWLSIREAAFPLTAYLVRRKVKGTEVTITSSMAISLGICAISIRSQSAASP